MAYRTLKNRKKAHRRSRPRLRACRYLLDAPALLWKRDPPPLPFCASPDQSRSPVKRKQGCLAVNRKEALWSVVMTASEDRFALNEER